MMAEVTSPSVGRDAAVLLRVRELRPDHLPRVHRVAASALTQRGPKMNARRLVATYARMGTLLDNPLIPPALRKQLLGEHEKFGAILFLAK